MLQQAVEFAPENVGDVFAWVSPPADRDWFVNVSFRGGLVGRELGQSLGQAGDGARQITHAPTGDVLLVEVVLLEQVQALKFGVGLGEGQDRRVA